jgi:YegS/Rv2252/BmrU family lipid kinase
MTYPEKHILLICNPTQDNAKALRMAERLSVLLTGMDIRYSAYTTQWPELLEGFSEAWIVGGDGTLNWFINCYPHAEIPLVIFPGGSGNDFHWMLYGEISMEKQAEHVLDCEARLVDAGLCNGQYFLNGVGIGFDGAIVKDLWGKKKLAGKASYLLSVMKNLIGYQEKECTVLMNDKTVQQDCLMISIANARRYGGGFMVAPRATVTDGLLDINLVGRISTVNRMRVLPVIEKGEHLDLSYVDYSQTAKISISSTEKQHAHIDGEYVYEDKYEIEVLPKRFSFLY